MTNSQAPSKELYNLARQIEAEAFAIPPPNQHTPRIVQLAQAIQRVTHMQELNERFAGRERGDDYGEIDPRRHVSAPEPLAEQSTGRYHVEVGTGMRSGADFYVWDGSIDVPAPMDAETLQAVLNRRTNRGTVACPGEGDMNPPRSSLPPPVAPDVDLIAEAAWGVLNHDNDPHDGHPANAANWKVLCDAVRSALTKIAEQP